VWVTSLVCGQGYRVVAVVALLLFRVGVGSPRKVKVRTGGFDGEQVSVGRCGDLYPFPWGRRPGD